jgi:hypothetical protein
MFSFFFTRQERHRRPLSVPRRCARAAVASLKNWLDCHVSNQTQASTRSITYQQEQQQLALGDDRTEES